ncbi:regulatory protein RecX [Ferviditalea candida]|uniref:Regulatory protein RecX n=1 Tax=Ferviditalea candida TaxID=3108399 RepID=A0ABU5ZJF1_9BACL|nr:RecX family transcriptional regulator [Paenibacillaceae bacterium T2]
MSMITMIKRRSTGDHLYDIYIDGRLELSVHEDIIVKHQLSKGGRLSLDQIASIRMEDQVQRVYQTALKRIARKPHSEMDLRIFLAGKGHPVEQIDQVMQILRERNYVNDEQFALMWAQQRIESDRKGRLWIKQELRRKGISDRIVRQALERMDEEEEYRSALELGMKRWGLLKGEDRKKWTKLMAYLLRRGYTSETVFRAVEEIRRTAHADLEDLNDLQALDDPYEPWEDA